MKRLQRRRHKGRLHASGAQPKPGPPKSDQKKPAEILSDTLVLTFPHKAKNHWYSVPVAFALHSAIILALILIPILMPQAVDPQLVLLFVNPAPPPPPPLRMGAQEVREKPEDSVPEPDRTPDIDPDRLLLPWEIPEEILTPNVELEHSGGTHDDWLSTSLLCQDRN